MPEWLFVIPSKKELQYKTTQNCEYNHQIIPKIVNVITKLYLKL